MDHGPCLLFPILDSFRSGRWWGSLFHPWPSRGGSRVTFWGGCVLPQPRCVARWKYLPGPDVHQWLRQQWVEVAILQVGSNDLSSQWHDATTVSDAVLAFARCLVHCHVVDKVLLCEPLPRYYRHPRPATDDVSFSIFNEKSLALRQSLESQCFNETSVDYIAASQLPSHEARVLCQRWSPLHNIWQQPILQTSSWCCESVLDRQILSYFSIWWTRSFSRPPNKVSGQSVLQVTK